MRRAASDLETKACILVVDDTPTNLHLLGGILLTTGYTVHAADDAEKALLLARTLPVDLILLDIMMPDMNGFEVCEQLKADERTRSIPVIFISAMSDTDHIIKGFDAGGVDYITKPIKIKEVLARVANHLTLVQQRKQIEALREQDRQHFEMLDRMKTRFIQMATHDLRNPLNVILGYSMLLQEVQVPPQDADFVQQALKEIRHSTDKMRHLVADMLDLARMEARAQLERTPVDLNAFLQGCLNSLQVVARQKSIRLEFHPCADSPTLSLDAGRMERVMDNLLSNAIKFTPEGGQVDVSVQIDDDTVAIQVQDTGQGIPAGDIPRLFDAFFRAEHQETRPVEGSGLGLSIVKAIVEQHGGQVLVASEPGRGSTFRVLLPTADC